MSGKKRNIIYINNDPHHEILSFYSFAKPIILTSDGFFPIQRRKEFQFTDLYHLRKVKNLGDFFIHLNSVPLFFGVGTKSGNTR